MIRDGVLEMSLLESAKETDNKLRWDTTVEGVRFSFYIPKWRVPNPWPQRIFVSITKRRKVSDDAVNLTHDDLQADPTAALEPIVATVAFFSEHTQTFRYDPVGDENEWEIGSPYIPQSLTGGATPRLRLIVHWDIASRGNF